MMYQYFIKVVPTTYTNINREVGQPTKHFKIKRTMSNLEQKLVFSHAYSHTHTQTHTHTYTHTHTLVFMSLTEIDHSYLKNIHDGDR